MLLYAALDKPLQKSKFHQSSAFANKAIPLATCYNSKRPHHNLNIMGPIVHDDDILTRWKRQYYLPQEADGDVRTQKEKVHLYRPPRSDIPGIVVACSVIGCWAALFIHALWFIKLPWTVAPGERATSWPHILAVFFSLEFLYTGLFITTHDAMHGTIALRHRRLNDFLGQLAISLYAWFDYSMLHRKHWEHHNHTGIPRVDPDFHRGNPHVLIWFGQFMISYMTVLQFVRIAAWSNVLLLLGASIANQLVFMTAAPLLSAFRLFYYGTYVPHHPPAGYTGPMPWHISRSSSVSRLQSFLTCYHFDLHWEHHRWPYAPWWQLPQCRQLASCSVGATCGPGAGSSEGRARGESNAGGCIVGGKVHRQQPVVQLGKKGKGEEGMGERMLAPMGLAAAVDDVASAAVVR